MGLNLSQHVVKGLSSRNVDRSLPCMLLLTSDREIDVSCFDLDPVTNPPHALRGQQCAAGTQKRVQNDIPSCRTVKKRIGDDLLSVSQYGPNGRSAGRKGFS